MNWNTVTVKKYQQIYSILSSEPVQGSPVLTELEQGIRLLAVLYDRAESEIESLTHGEYLEGLKAIEFLHTEKLNGTEGVKYFQVNRKRRYRFVYDVRKMRIARIAEVKTFTGQGLIENLHRVAASFAVPQRRNCFGIWVDARYDSTQHDQYAEDMRNAPISLVYGNVVFFCKVFRNSIDAIRDYLISALTQKGMEKAKAETLIKDLCETLDGYIRSSL